MSDRVTVRDGNDCYIPLEEHSRVHRAMLDAGRHYGLALADVRVLVALAQRDGRADTAELQRDLLCESASVRRSLGALRPEFCSGGDKRGVRLPIEITIEGRAVVADVAWHLRETEVAA